ncbi:hypothetical protein Hdeb2414_s0003g00084231 [Helianthus debilis subsp. tardiflorus]
MFDIMVVGPPYPLVAEFLRVAPSRAGTLPQPTLDGVSMLSGLVISDKENGVRSTSCWPSSFG